MFTHWYGSTFVVLTVLSTAVQLYVMWLVVYRSPKSMSEYRFFLCLYTFCDMAFALTLGLAVHPGPLENGYFYLDGLGALFGVTSAHVSVGISFFAGAAMFMALDYCLIYRTAIIMEDQRFYEFFVSKAGFVAFIFFGIVMAGGVAALAYGFVDVTENLTQFAVELPELAAALPHGTILARMKTEESWTVRSTLALFGGLALSELVSFVAVFVIMRTLKRNARYMSKKTYRLQVQPVA
ncbi:hypothetical protein AAVH_12113 [Aphelenchoides avenae]|nr:hypothetical protein AAVH_12113 [Aphelenchus avenae]